MDSVQSLKMMIVINVTFVARLWRKCKDFPYSILMEIRAFNGLPAFLSFAPALWSPDP